MVHFLLREQPALFLKLLSALQLAQGMNTYSRKLGEHVERESFSWTYSVSLEVQLMRVLQQVFSCLSIVDGRAGPEPGEDLVRAARTCILEAARDNPLPFRAPVEGRPRSLDEGQLRKSWDWLLGGKMSVSVHLPMQRAVGAALAALVRMDKRAGAGLPTATGLERLLSNSPAECEAALKMLGPAVVFVLAWLAQVRARLWLRNGDEVTKVEVIYRNSFWHDSGMDLDYLLLQVWASRCDPGAVAGQVMHPFGGGVFLAAVGGDGAGEPEIDGQRLACIAEGLRLLVTLFRNRLSFVSENEHLRLQLINWLCAKERCTHSQISKELSHALQAHPKLDEILREIADYSAPRLQEHGHYTLKKAFWDDFDPYFAHFSREDAENALDRAMQSGAWAPKQQLRTPGRPPAPLGDILAVLAAPATHQLIWAALRYTWDRDDGSSNGITIHALHLLSLCAAHDAEAVRIFESKQKPQQVTSSTIAAVLGNAVTPAGFQGGSILEAVVHCPSGGSPILGLLEAVQAKGLNKDPEDFLAKSSQVVHECATAVLETLQVHGGSRGRSVSVPSSPSRGAGGAKVWKQTAKEVQAAALAEMAKQQAAFAAMLEDSSDEEECADAGLAEGMDLDAGAGDRRGEGGSRAGCSYGGYECVFCRGESDLVDEDTPLGLFALSQFSNMPEVALRPDVPFSEAVRLHKEEPREDRYLSSCGASAGTSAPGGGGASISAAMDLEDMAAWGPAGGESEPQEETQRPGTDGGGGGGGASGATLSSERGPAAQGSGGWRVRETVAGVGLLDVHAGFHVQTCGHAAHHACLAKYQEGLIQRFGSGLRYEGMLQLNVLLQEFLCPVCRRVCNSLLPVVPRSATDPPEARGSTSSGGGEGRAHSPPPSAVSDLVREADAVLDFLEPGGRGWLSGAPSVGSVPAAGAGAPEVREAELVVHPVFQRPRLRHHCEMSHRFAAYLISMNTDCFAKVGSDRLAFDPASHSANSLLKGFNPPAALACSQQLWHTAAFNVCHLETVTRGGSEGLEKWNLNSQFLALRQLVYMTVTSTCSEGGREDGTRRALRYLFSGSPETPDGRSWTPKLLDAMGEMALLSKYGCPATATYRDVVAQRTAGSPALAAGLAHERRWAVAGGEASSSVLGWRALCCDPFVLLLELLQSSPNIVATWVGEGPALMEGARLAVGKLLPLAFTVGAFQNAVLALAVRGGEVPGIGISPAGLDASPAPCSEENLEAARGALCELRSLIDRNSGSEERRQWLLEYVGLELRPFLRRAAIFRAALRGAEQLDSDALRAADLAAESSLPDLQAVLSMEVTPAQLCRWCAHLMPLLRQRSAAAAHANALSLPREPRRPRLIRIPAQFQDALVQWNGQRCLTCGKVPREPGLCLLSGKLVCCMEKCCSSPDQVGECTQHAFSCGGGTGVFLLLKQSSLLLVRGSRASVFLSPYLDSHGEEDIGLQRGRPLFLNAQRFEALEALWMLHGFDTDTRILRQTHGGTRRQGAYSV